MRGTAREATPAHGAADVTALQEFFARHVTLDGEPYTLDADQAEAVLDDHKNCLVTARAGSGKTRVIVAKIIYLIASGKAVPIEIVAFMFNRTVAAEVNERASKVEVDGRRLLTSTGQGFAIASTFHKFALDLVRSAGIRPKIISEADSMNIIRRAFTEALLKYNLSLTPHDYREYLKLAASFIARAGQKFCGADGIAELKYQVESYCVAHAGDDSYHAKIKLHRLALETYTRYLEALSPPLIDFNLLMNQATEILGKGKWQHQKYKYLLVDEYQDFSYLFYALIQALRGVCPAAHLFVVGDDWQAINRFAGSDVRYFTDFSTYFPEDYANIHLLTNYRSSKRIVENANDYMLSHYDKTATRAKAFCHQQGKVCYVNFEKTRLDPSDINEDCLGDGRYIRAIESTCNTKPKRSDLIRMAKLLKETVKIVRHNRHAKIMLLHRHNFLSAAELTLEGFLKALRQFAIAENILSPESAEANLSCLTMHRSKGLEAEVVILLEFERSMLLMRHPHATLFEIFGDNQATEKADQERLLYVALTRAKKKLYLLGSDQKCLLHLGEV